MTSDSAFKMVKGKERVISSLLPLLNRVPQFTRMGRHLLSVVKHSTCRKLYNLILVELEYRLRKINTHGYPYIVIIDPMNICNLHCPLCPTGTGELNRRQQTMSWEVFTKTVDDVAPYTYEINLHNWGESLLHPRIFEMIQYIKEKNIATNISSNFNLITEDKIDKLITSGLEYLILSIDGVTQDNYQKYRIGGDVDKVFENIKTLLKRRRQLGSSTPYVEWQFIVFKHNMHEVDSASKFAEELGVDRFRVIPPGLPFAADNQEALKNEWFIPKIDENGVNIGLESFREELGSTCFYLYRSVTINPDGGLAPCCIVYGKKNDFGDLNLHNIHNIWNNSKYHSARSLFKKKGKASEYTVCENCNLFKKYGSVAARKTNEN